MIQTLRQLPRQFAARLGDIQPAHLLSLAFALVPMYAAYLLIRRYSYNFPYWDDWSFVVRFYANDQPPWEFWKLYNGHRVFIPQVLMLIIARLTDMDMRVYLYIDLAFAIGTVFLLYWIFRRTSRIAAPYLVLPAFALLYISLGSFPSWIVAPSFPNWTSQFYCIGGLWVATCWKPGWRSLIMGAGFAYMGSLSLFYGNFIWLIVPLGWFLRGYRGWRQYALWGVLAASVLIPYAYEYVFLPAPEQQSSPFLISYITHFTLAFVGSAVSGSEQYVGLSRALPMGVAGVVAFGGVIAVSIIQRWRLKSTSRTALVTSPPDPLSASGEGESIPTDMEGGKHFSATQEKNTLTSSGGVPDSPSPLAERGLGGEVNSILPWFLLGLLVLLIAFSAGVGRAVSVGVFLARAERFNPVSGLFWIAVVALLAIFLSQQRRGLIGVGAIVLIFFIASGWVQRQFNVIDYLVSNTELIGKAHDCLVRYYEDMSDDCLKLVNPNRSRVREILAELPDVHASWLIPRQFQVRKATLDPPNTVYFETRQIDDTRMPLIFAHAPSKIDWMYTVPTGKQVTLRTGVLVDIPAEYTVAPGDGVLFEIVAVVEGESRSLYRAQVAPRAAGQGFRPVTIDLTDLAGQDIHLVLTTKAGEAANATLNYDWALWQPLDVTVSR